MVTVCRRGSAVGGVCKRGLGVKVRVWILLLILLAGSVAVAGVLIVRRPEMTAALRGKQIAMDLGCFACHGPEGQGGISDPTNPGGELPDWRSTTMAMYVASELEIREWILDGVTRQEREHRAIDDHRPLVPMPAYRDQLTAGELDDLVTYVVAVSGWHEAIPDDVFEGRKIAQQMGCFGCHGPSGMGGVANPGSFKGYIPPWDGTEFDELVQNKQELRDWILDGRIDRLWDNSMARFFLDRQKTPMPAYHDYLSDAELDKLVAYIWWLRPATRKSSGKDRGASTVIGTTMRTGVE